MPVPKRDKGTTIRTQGVPDRPQAGRQEHPSESFSWRSRAPCPKHALTQSLLSAPSIILYGGRKTPLLLKHCKTKEQFLFSLTSKGTNANSALPVGPALRPRSAQDSRGRSWARAPGRAAWCRRLPGFGLAQRQRSEGCQRKQATLAAGRRPVKPPALLRHPRIK